MSLLISFSEFEKMVEKECIKQTGMTLQDFPNIYCEDFWPTEMNEKVSIQISKELVESIVNSVMKAL